MKGRFHLKSKQRKVIYQTREGVFHLTSKHEKECFIWYPNTRRSVLFDIQTRERVLFDIQTLRSDISNTRSVSFDIRIPRSNIRNTRESVSFYIQATYISSTRPEGVLHVRMSVSSDIQTPRSNKSNMRRSVYTIFNHWEVIWYPRKRRNWT